MEMDESPSMLRIEFWQVSGEDGGAHAVSGLLVVGSSRLLVEREGQKYTEPGRGDMGK
jgi:uncharacterized protein affecting Mg2+/Co2+ transport